jgi:hypothetical protein
MPVKIPQDELVPALQGIQAILTLLAFRTTSDPALSELLHRAAELLNDAVESQI